MERWAGKVAVVTGASAGIGLAVSKGLVQHGLIVVGLARRKTKMEDEMKDVNGKGKFYAVQCDITKEEDVKNAFKWIKENLLTVHILINNAGIYKPGTMIDMSLDDIKSVIDVNLLGLIMCTKSAINMMKEGNHESHVVMINSVVGRRISPVVSSGNSTNVYSATKFAVTALAQTLEKEVFGTEIRVTNISPGAVKSEMTLPYMNNPQVCQFMNFLEAEDIADAVMYVLGTPHRVRIEELTIKPRIINRYALSI